MLAELLAHVPPGARFALVADPAQRWTAAELRAELATWGDGGLDWRGGRTPGGMRLIRVARPDGTLAGDVLEEEFDG